MLERLWPGAGTRGLRAEKTKQPKLRILRMARMGREVFRKIQDLASIFPFAIFVSFVVPAVPAFCSPYVFIRVHLRLKMPENPKKSVGGPKIAILGRKWAENGVFRRFLILFRLRGPLRLVSVDDFLSEAYARTGKARISCNKVE